MTRASGRAVGVRRTTPVPAPNTRFVCAGDRPADTTAVTGAPHVDCVDHTRLRSNITHRSSVSLAVIELLETKRKQSGTMPAGAFAAWLEQYLRAQTQPEPAGEVPCGDCTACCKASYFIAIADEERATIERIPRVHLTVSTHNPPEWALDQSCSGSCPMLVNDACSIYANRPRACRRFDCRVFAATAISPGSGPRTAVNQQVWRWRFDYPSAADAIRQTALLNAVAFMQRRADLIDPAAAPADTSELAKAAVCVHEVFLQVHIEQQDDEQIAAALNQKLRTIAAGSSNAQTAMHAE